MNLAQYQKALEQHDWFYARSDDPVVYQAGVKKHSELTGLAMEKGGQFLQAWVHYKKRAHAGGH